MAKTTETPDEKVFRLIADVKKRREEIGALKKPQWTTSCSLTLPGFDGRINIQVEKDLTILAIAIGILTEFHNYVGKVNTALGTKIDATWDGYPFKEWVEDIELRIKITQIQAEQQKLKGLENKLKPLLSEDQRRELALADIEAELS